MDRELIERIVVEVIRRLKALSGEETADWGGEPAVRLVTEELVVETAARGGREIRVGEGGIVTPLARDALWREGIALVEVTDAEEGGSGAGRTLGRIAVGADQRGEALKEALKGMLRGAGREVVDCGAGEAVAEKVAVAVAEGRCEAGIVADGAGGPSAIVANKVVGVRATACHDVTSAKFARAHVDANVLCLGVGTVGDTVAREIVATWLTTPFEGGKYADGVRRIEEIERRRCRG